MVSLPPRNIALVTMGALCLFLLPSCGSALTPESAVQSELKRRTDIFDVPLENVQVLGIRDWPDDPQQKLVLFRGHRGGEPNLGYTRVIRENLTWRVIEHGYGPSEAHPPDAHRFPDQDMFSVLGGGHQSPDESYFIAYGESPVPGTVSIEGRFDNGHIARDQTTEGAYILVGPLCELRALDADKRVLRTIDLSPAGVKCVK